MNLPLPHAAKAEWRLASAIDHMFYCMTAHHYNDSLNPYSQQMDYDSLIQAVREVTRKALLNEFPLSEQSPDTITAWFWTEGHCTLCHLPLSSTEREMEVTAHFSCICKSAFGSQS